jgi:hypothetical protein
MLNAKYFVGAVLLALAFGFVRLGQIWTHQSLCLSPCRSSQSNDRDCLWIVWIVAGARQRGLSCEGPPPIFPS